MNSAAADAAITRWTGDAMQSRLRKRYRSERLFKLLGLAAVGVSLAFLAFLLGTMLWKGMGGLTTDFLRMSDSTDPELAGVWGALKGSFLTILVTMALTWVVLRVGERVVLRMGQTGIRVMTRIMGLLLAAIAVQFVITGAKNALKA